VRKRKVQQGVSLTIILSFISALLILSAITAKVMQGQGSIQSKYAFQANAIDLQKSADALRTNIASLRLTYGVIDPVIATNQISSATGIFSAMPLPVNAATMAVTGWGMANGDRLIVPVSGEWMKVATIDVVPGVCAALNIYQIKSDNPVLSATSNAFGGTTFSVSNASFNAGLASDFFCVTGGGTNGAGRVYVGINA